MFEDVEYIAIGSLEGSRLKVTQDTDAENPLEWVDHVTEGDNVHSQWAAGEVYGVILERAKVYTATDGATLTNWEEVESLWGCYLTPQYSAETVALEYFTLTEPERVALTEQTNKNGN